VLLQEATAGLIVCGLYVEARSHSSVVEGTQVARLIICICDNESPGNIVYKPPKSRK